MTVASVSVRGVSKSYGDVSAVSHVSFDVEKGTVLGLLGPNGAGKTTIIRMLTTLCAPDAGSITVEGFDTVKEPDAVRQVIGLAGQYAAVDEHLTGRENLTMVARLSHRSRADAAARAERLLREFDLSDVADRVLGTYSGGLRRRLDLAASLVNDPRVLFLDEPTTGLDPRSRFALWRSIRALVAGGTTVLLTTQYLEEADHLANTVLVIDQGMVVESGTPSELKSKIGADVLQVRIADISQVNRASEALRTLGGAVRVDLTLNQLTMPVRSAGTLPKAVRALDSAHIDIEDIEVRTPTLDEVFIKLTGHPADGDARASEISL